MTLTERAPLILKKKHLKTTRAIAELNLTTALSAGRKQNAVKLRAQANVCVHELGPCDVCMDTRIRNTDRGLRVEAGHSGTWRNERFYVKGWTAVAVAVNPFFLN